MFTSGTIGDGAFESLTSGNVKYSRDALIAHTALNEGCALCAIGKCCGDILSVLTCTGARGALRAALGCAMEDETISRNPAAAKGLTRSAW